MGEGVRDFPTVRLAGVQRMMGLHLDARLSAYSRATIFPLGTPWVWNAS